MSARCAAANNDKMNMIWHYHIAIDIMIRILAFQLIQPFFDHLSSRRECFCAGGRAHTWVRPYENGFSHSEKLLTIVSANRNKIRTIL